MSTAAEALVNLNDLYLKGELNVYDVVVAPRVMYYLAEAIIAGTYTCTTKEV